MPKKIFKYGTEITMLGTRGILMPKGAVIVNISAQRNDICAWAEVDEEDQNTDPKNFTEAVFWYNTGEEHIHNPVTFSYFDTIKLLNDQLVIHVYVENNMLLKS